MIPYILRRILSLLLTVWLVMTLVFFAMHILPGDPAVAILGNQASAKAITQLRHELGLNRPLYQQYFDFIFDLTRGDLGISLASNKSVISLIIAVLPYSAILATGALIISALIGIPIGILSALRRNTLLDYFGRVFALLGLSTPSFYLGILLLILFSVKLNLFPMIGAGELSNLGSTLSHLFLPALSLGLINASIIMRMTRSSLLDVLNEDYIQTARSKGLRETIVVYKHALRNSLIEIITVLGVYLPVMLGAEVLTEIVFNRPGIGKLLVGSVYNRDYTLIQSTLLLFAVLVALINLLTDLTYGLCDPRVRYD